MCRQDSRIDSHLAEVDDVVERHGPAKKRRVTPFNFSAMSDGLESIIGGESDDESDDEPVIGERELYARVLSLWQHEQDPVVRTRLSELMRLYCSGNAQK